MRYLLPFVVVLLCSFTLSAQDYGGSEQDSTESIFNEETIQGLALLKTLMDDSPAYELYRTDNMWTFLKLETSTGKIWQVQYAVGNGDAFQVVLNDISLSKKERITLISGFRVCLQKMDDKSDFGLKRIVTVQ